MGYRCPCCKKEFGNDRDALQKHFSNNLKCAVEAICIFHDKLEIAVKGHEEFSLEETKEEGNE